MTQTQTIATGSPVWFDLSTPDPEGSRKFYSQLFGWTADVLPDAGGYGFFNLGGKMVGGVGPQQNPQQPPSWNTYILTDDAQATATKARDAGGSVLLEPMNVMDQGTMTFIADPSGAAIGGWQPAQHQGVQVKDVPNSPSWVELHSHDIQAAKPFYTTVFGWDTRDSDMGDGMMYTEFKLGDTSVAGGTAMRPGEEGLPSHWFLYFATDNVDTTTPQAEGLGATALLQPTDFPGGRFSVLRDPQGAVFGLLTLNR